MEIRIGVIHTPKELTVEVDGTADDVIGAIDDALAEGTPVVWLDRQQGSPDRRSPPSKIAYVEIDEDGGAAAVGFGR